MAIKWSPGCGCCESVGCDEFAIGFTPTTEQDREGYAAWTNFTEYLKDDEFSHYSNNDGWTYLYRVPMTLFSGSGWTSFEESRYTKVRRVDIHDEVEEWDLLGDGWLSLSALQKQTYLLDGRLTEDMGYVSKDDVLPSVESWHANFAYNIQDIPPPQTEVADFAFQGSTEILVSSVAVFAGISTPFEVLIGYGPFETKIVTSVNQQQGSITFSSGLSAQYSTGTPVLVDGSGRDGLILKTMSQLSVDQSGEPIDYFYIESEYVDEDSDPEGTEIIPPFPQSQPTIAAIRTPIKSKTGKFVGGSDTVFDTNWSQLLPKKMCRSPSISEGTLFGAVTPGVDELIGFSFADPVERNKCYLATGDGVVASSNSFPATGLAVFDGDLIKYIGPTSSDPSSWEVIEAANISLTDAMSGAVAVENPDPASELSGRKVGLYVVKGVPLSYVRSFSGVSGSLTKTLANVRESDCPVCETRSWVCEGASEIPVYIEGLSSPSVIQSAESMIENFVTEAAFLWYGPGAGSDNTNGYSTGFLDFGVIVRRSNVNSFGIARIGAQRSFQSYLNDSVNGYETTMLIAQDVSFVCLPINGFQTAVITSSSVYAYHVLARQVSPFGFYDGPTSIEQFKSKTEPPLYADLPRSFHYVVKTIKTTTNDPGGGILRLASSTPQINIVDTEAFHCNSFAIQGTYDIDESQLNGQRNAWINSQSIVGQTWSINSI